MRKKKSIFVTHAGTGKHNGKQRSDVPTDAVLIATQESLTSVFGMGTGVPSPLWSPTKSYVGKKDI